MRALIALADAPDGQIDVKVTHVDGFVATSNAHRLVQQIVKFLDEQCERKTPLAADEVTPEERAFAARVGAPILVPRP